MNWKTAAFPIWLGIGAFAIGVKFPVFWDRWVYYPAIPDILDTVWLVLTGGYLIALGMANLNVKPGGFHGEKAFPSRLPLSTTEIREDERGVEPIVATLVMVAITVILAIVLYILVAHLIGA